VYTYLNLKNPAFAREYLSSNFWKVSIIIQHDDFFHIWSAFKLLRFWLFFAWMFLAMAYYSFSRHFQIVQSDDWKKNLESNHASFCTPFFLLIIRRIDHPVCCKRKSQVFLSNFLPLFVRSNPISFCWLDCCTKERKIVARIQCKNYQRKLLSFYKKTFYSHCLLERIKIQQKN
jgi:hypothetical protein